MPSVQQQGNDRLTLGIVLGVITFWLFAQSVVNVAPDIQNSVDISIDSLNLAISLSTLFSGCFIVVAGSLADKFGRVKFTYLGFILSIIGSFCLAIADGSILFSIGRVIQGISGACIMPATLALMKTYYSGVSRQRALSFWSIGSWGGSGLCSLAGGAIATYMGWRWIFILSIVIAVIGMLLIRGTPESKVEYHGSQPTFDYAGLSTFIIAIMALNLFITKGDALGWLSADTILLFAIFIMFSAAFFMLGYLKKERGFIDFALFKNRAYSGATFSNFMLNAVAGTLIVANTYVQAGRGFTSFQSGMLSIGYLIAVLVMIRIGEKVLQKIGAKKPMMWGTTITGIGVALMSLTFLPNIPYISAVLIGFIMFGLGLGFYATPSTDTAISNVPTDKVGMASGIYKMASSLGGAFGVAISASVYATCLPLGTATAASAGLLVNVTFCILSALIIFFMLPASTENEK